MEGAAIDDAECCRWICQKCAHVECWECGAILQLPLGRDTIHEFFANPACDPSGCGEGQTFLGQATVTTDASGNAIFGATLPAPSVGQVVTAAATDPARNTSEFCHCVAVAASPLSGNPIPMLDRTRLALLAVMLMGTGVMLLSRA
jgi:hypothetical protein